MRVKWGWRVAAFLLLMGVIWAASRTARTAVVDVKKKLKPEKTSWEGVVTVGLVPSFPTVNLDGWLQASFRSFEKQQSNVLVSLRKMTTVGVRTGAASGTLPDVLLVGLNILEEPEQLFVPLDDETCIREDLYGAGKVGQTRYALPVAMGGYALMGNRRLLDGVGWSPKCDFAQTMALLAEKGQSVAAPQIANINPMQALTEMGEVGSVQVENSRVHAKVWPDFVLEQKYTFYVGTQREVRRMQTLCSAGKGFETVLMLPKNTAYTDQILLGGVVRSELTNAEVYDREEKEKWSAQLILHLLKEEQQMDLNRAYLFSVLPDQHLYEDGTQMAALEASLRSVFFPKEEAAHS